jgi:hypothetical protein
MTVNEIIKAITPLKPCSKPQMYRYLREVRAKPLGARQRPQRYPDEVVGRILLHLGFEQLPNGERLIPFKKLVSISAKARREKARGK